ncbi:MAG: biotin/lipoyl-binding protein [Bdellovibrio sp.]|nr:biotin/lipoyl-binding protein [Bdellovibrio sp.]
MSALKGQVGAWHFDFAKLPIGLHGIVQVKINEKDQLMVEWFKDAQGISIKTEHGVFSFDLLGEVSEEGLVQYQVKQRGSSEVFSSLHFLTSGAELFESQNTKLKHGIKIKAQMPGKVLKILIKEGQAITEGEPMIVIEAMKMENQVSSVHNGKVKKIFIEQGQAVETGEALVLLE